MRDRVIQAKKNQVNLLKQEINLVGIEYQLQVKKTQDAIEKFKNKIVRNICSNLPNAFWHRKHHEVELSYEPDFSEKNIPIKTKPIRMNEELLSYCEKKIQDLLDKRFLRKSKSQAELERGIPRLVINHKPLVDALRWIRNPISNQINFLVPLGHYEWSIMPQLYVFIIIEVLFIKTIKPSVKALPSLAFDDLEAFKIDGVNTLDIEILKQSNGNHEILVRHTTQHIYSIIKKEFLRIILCISKFQDDLLNQEFLLRVDCKSVKLVFQKDVKNIASKHNFARGQAILSNFGFQIKFIKREDSIPDNLTHEFCWVHETMAPKKNTQGPKSSKS